MNLTEMRAYVREHIDLDEGDLPDSLLDVWLRDAHRRIQEYAHNWPHLVDEAEVTVGDDGVVDVSGWRAVQEVRIDRYSLREIPHGTAKRQYPNNNNAHGLPAYYSFLGDQMFVWPRPTDDLTIYVRGLIEPGDWPTFTTTTTTTTTVSWPSRALSSYGLGAPTEPDTEGAVYVDITDFSGLTGMGGLLYEYADDQWNGPKTLVFGTGAPTSSTEANNGDWYVDVAVPATPSLYGPRSTTTTSTTTQGPATPTPTHLPTRLTEMIARLALADAYLREGDSAMAQNLLSGAGQELDVYKNRVINISNSERFYLGDGGLEASTGQLRYSWE